jgi:signal transduction histidine kinase
MPSPDEVQRLREEIRRLQAELEQARVTAEDGAEQAQQSASETQALQIELRRISQTQRSAELSIGELRARLAIVVGAQEAERAVQGAAEEELQVVIEELEVLAEELQQANESLRLANVELDERVAARTRELGEANIALSDRELRLSLAMRHAQAGSWDWQLDSGKLLVAGEALGLYANRSIATLADWLEAALPEDRSRLQAALHQCASGESAEVAVEYRIEHPQKGLRWLSSRGRLVKTGGVEPAAISGLTTDITELKAAENLLKRHNDDLTRRVAEAIAANESAREQLFQKQKLEALGQLTGGVAHDFNNLLAVISNSLQLTAMVDDGAERARLIERMQTAVDRGSALTRRLLSFGRRQALKPELIDLRRCIGDFLELVRPSLRADVDIQGGVEASTYPVWLDSGELQLAMINLCVNARDAMPGGGRIDVRVRNCGLASDRRMPTGAGEWVEISVTDNGSGMSADVLSHVFEPFFTTKDVGEGTGLGLAQVHGFVNQSGGTVHAASRPGEGPVVRMLLPRASAAAVTSAPPANDVVPVPDSVAGAQILMVEDDEELGPLVEQMLQRKFRVRRVLTAQAALDQLQHNGDDFALVFTDIRLPAGINGLQLAQRVRELHPRIPVVVTTGYGGSLIAEAMTFGLPVLRKPYRFDELLSLLSTALAA